MSSTEKPTLLLIDGHSLAFRAFYALSPDSFRTTAGQHTNAVHGFISMMLNILQAEKPTHLAVAFDLSRESFRTEVYPEYKGTRGETPPEFIGQTELLQKALDAMNIKWFTKVNYEADDIIASFAHQGAEAGFDVYVVSGDRDTFQLISERTTILYPIKGVMNLARMDDAAVYEKYGVHAKQYPDLAALVGETSDNLPGIPGVGPKTAAKWLQEYHSLEAIFDNAAAITGKVGESLREHLHLAKRNRELNHLLTTLDMGVTLEELELDGVDEAAVRKVFAELQFRTLTERVIRLRGLSKSSSKTDVESDSAEAFEIEESLGTYRAPELPEVTEASLDEALQFAKSGPVGMAVTFTDSSVASVGFATAEKRLLVRNPDAQKLSTWLNSEVPKYVFGGKDLERQLRQRGLGISNIRLDALLLAYLLNPVRRGYGIDAIAEEYLGISVARADQNALIPENETDDSMDAWLAFALSERTWSLVEEQQQDTVYREVEAPSSSTLARMEVTGVQVNREALEKMLSDLAQEIAEAERECFQIIGKEINLASPKQLQTVLFEDLGMTGNKKVKTGFSTNAESLTTLFEETGHPFLEALLKHREVTKIRQMVEVLVKSIAADGRIHTNYVQTGTSTGRLSSEGPNLQNIPIKTERGREIRDAFVVGDGFETLLTADYSQIEMRIMAHLSEDEGLIEAFNTGEDLHRFVGSRIFGVAPSEVTPAMRSKVKAMSYGLVYGLSEYGLAKQLRISNAEAKQLMADYFARFGGVRRYLASVVDGAKLNGYTVTTYGRRRPFDDLRSPIFQIRENARRAALNAPIQGTAADIMKVAMVNIDRAMIDQGLHSRMLLQVHDELVFEVASGELERLHTLVTTHMANVAKLSVPLEVHVGVGKSWDAAGH
ncbi:MAG: hypothetical protein RLZZ400_633 [Actinomycetota bacterium]|jgi:DNA polymerase-1